MPDEPTCLPGIPHWGPAPAARPRGPVTIVIIVCVLVTMLATGSDPYTVAAVTAAITAMTAEPLVQRRRRRLPMPGPFHVRVALTISGGINARPVR